MKSRPGLLHCTGMDKLEDLPPDLLRHAFAVADKDKSLGVPCTKWLKCPMSSEWVWHLWLEHDLEHLPLKHRSRRCHQVTAKTCSFHFISFHFISFHFFSLMNLVTKINQSCVISNSWGMAQFLSQSSSPGFQRWLGYVAWCMTPLIWMWPFTYCIAVQNRYWAVGFKNNVCICLLF